MTVDIIVAEIGSTTTKVNAFSDINSSNPLFLGHGQALTTVMEGDVNIGLQTALARLAENIGEKKINYEKMAGTSSAAGGLKMTVHGLVYDMTVKAAKEAALGAGAILHMITAGELRQTDLKKLKEIEPNIILIAGGLDYGERETAIKNAKRIKELELGIPVIYAGNCQNREEIKQIFQNYRSKIYITENVYPKLDQLNIEPTRKIIQQVFEEHIVYAPGMTNIKQMIKNKIIPVPGAVMQAAKTLYEEIGDLMVIDVGGATTDVHSVTPGSDKIARILINPEPTAKRTVEGDLGMYVNMYNIIEKIGLSKLKSELNFNPQPVIQNMRPIPVAEYEIILIEKLCKEAVLIALKRHAGIKKFLYGSSGRQVFAEGKDLTQIKYIIGTGGALSNLPKRVEILEQIAVNCNAIQLYPTCDAKILIDRSYIMSSLGVLAFEYPESANKLMKQSLGL